MYRRNAVLVLSLAASLLLFSRPLQAAEEGNNGVRMQIGKSETFVHLKAGFPEHKSTGAFFKYYGGIVLTRQ